MPARAASSRWRLLTRALVVILAIAVQVALVGLISAGLVALVLAWIHS